MAHLDIGSGVLVANASETERTGFIRRTYLHLVGAILAFTALETVLVQTGVAEAAYNLVRNVPWSWFIVLALFMVVSYVSDRWAQSSMSREMQYAGLGLFVVAEAIIFMPLIYMALNIAPGSGVLPAAAFMTIALTAGITFTAFSTRKDFSFLAPFLTVGGFVALGLILVSMIFGFSLGIFFFGAMVLFAGAAILYQTSQIIHHYHTDQHVAASLGLFSSVGLMFWYIVQFLMALGSGE